MKQSKLFTKTRKEAPSDEVSRNAQLLIRAGFVHKHMAGVYEYLPLGLRVLRKIENIIREEMNALGAQEVFLSTLQDPELWKKTDRWGHDKMDMWFTTELAGGTEIGIGNTHEEPLTAAVAEYVSSYKELPQYVYQIQNKFRNEKRAKSGLFRGREFLMKDLYSFNKTEEDFRKFYERVAESYMNIFARCGVGDSTFRTRASGGVFSKFSDEFQTLSEAGEDTIYLDEEKKIAVNKEVYTDDVLDELGLDKGALVEKKSIEVGNIFPLGTRFSEPLGLMYTDEKGNDHPVVMGSYGIGLGRLMGTVVEVLSDDEGIVWPRSITPFDVHIVVLPEEEGKGIRTEAEKLYTYLEAEGVTVLYDDREDVSAGEKFAESDLIGIPTRVVVSAKTLEKGAYEVKDRATGNVEFMSDAEVVAKCKK